MSFTTRRIREEAPRKTPRWQRYLPLALKLAGPLLGWYSAWKKRHDAQQKKERRIAVLKRIFLVLVAVLCMVLLFGALARALVALRVITIPGILQSTGAELPTDEHGFTNILLLGQGDASHDGKDLTDTIMVASLDPEGTESAVLLSLPRDLYFLHTENMGKGRVNSLYREYKSYTKTKDGLTEQEASLRAMQELAREIGRALDLQIHHVVKVDFVGFTQAVDEIGGVDIVVPEAIVDTEYPGPNYTYETFSIAAGPKHLDGETALKYARSRHTSSDFDRSARQQQILAALAEKAKSEGFHRSPSTVMSLYRIVSEHMETTMTIRELVGLAAMGEKIDRSRILAMQLNDRNGLYGSFANPGGFLYAPPREQFEGAAVLLPVSIPAYPVTWKQVHSLTRVLTESRSLLLGHPRIRVLNAGAKGGLAGALGTELIRYGFDVEDIANAGGEKRETSLIVAQAGSEEEAQAMSTMLRISLGSFPTDIATEKAGPITIILGKNFTFTPLQDLLP